MKRKPRIAVMQLKDIESQLLAHDVSYKRFATGTVPDSFIILFFSPVECQGDIYSKLSRRCQEHSIPSSLQYPKFWSNES